MSRPTWDERARVAGRPSGRRVMLQNWRELLFVHYAVDPGEIQSRLPAGLTVDTHPDASGSERAWLGVVLFRMEGIRPAGLPPIPGTSAFLEANVRTYVHVDGQAPAVFFFSLDAENRLACATARRFFHLPYHHADMTVERTDKAFAYRSVRRSDGARIEARWHIGSGVVASPARTLSYWLLERYVLITSTGTELRYGCVQHRPYETTPATLDAWEDDLSSRVGVSRGQVAHVTYCEGVDTEIWPLRSAQP